MKEFIAGRRFLDFVATVAERDSQPEEKLNCGADLVAWLTDAGFHITADMAAEEGLQRSREVRDSMYGLLAAFRDGRAFESADLDAVNGAAEALGPVPHLSRGGALTWSGGVDSALAAMSRECLELLGGTEARQLRWCADKKCTRPFLDRSRSHNRRWCGTGCGDRAKAATYRARHSVDGQASV